MARASRSAGTRPRRRPAPRAAEQLAYHVHAHLDVVRQRQAGDGAGGHRHQHPRPRRAFRDGRHRRARPTVASGLARSHASRRFTRTTTPACSIPSRPLPRRNRLGQFFTEWGVRLDRSCVGGYCRPQAPIAIFVDGKRYNGDPRSIGLANHLEIAIVVGSPPSTIPDVQQPGLSSATPRTLTQRELNRAVLARQLLLERARSTSRRRWNGWAACRRSTRPRCTWDSGRDCEGSSATRSPPH